MYYSLGLLTLLMLVLQIAQQMCPEYAVTPALEYSKDAISNGELWRIWTGHLVHSNGYHTAMNLAALLILLLLFSGPSWRRTTQKNAMQTSCELEFVLASLGAMLAVSAGLYYLVPSLQFYVGFSGVLHGLFLYYFITRLESDRIVFTLAITAIIAKVMWEQTPWSDQTGTAALIETKVAIQAHLFGAIYGILAGLSSRLLPTALGQEAGH